MRQGGRRARRATLIADQVWGRSSAPRTIDHGSRTPACYPHPGPALAVEPVRWPPDQRSGDGASNYKATKLSSQLDAMYELSASLVGPCTLSGFNAGPHGTCRRLLRRCKVVRGLNRGRCVSEQPKRWMKQIFSQSRGHLEESITRRHGLPSSSSKMLLCPCVVDHLTGIHIQSPTIVVKHENDLDPAH